MFGKDFLALTVPCIAGDSQDDRRCVFSVLNTERHSGCKGVRLFKIASNSAGMDDYWDRGVFGIFLHYDRLVIELLWVRIMVS